MTKIVIAEDAPLQMEMMKAALSARPDFKLSFVTDGLELYQTIQKEPPDLALVDIIMPKLSGLAVTRLVKFHRKTAGVKIVVVSSITDEDIESRAKKCGADDFIAKPLDFEQLLPRLEKLL